MASYLYYRRGAEWVRVAADSYTRETAPGEPIPFDGGQCVTRYKVESEIYLRYSDGSTKTAIGRANFDGPITGPYGEAAGTGYRIWARCNGVLRQIQGAYVGPPYSPTVTGWKIVSVTRIDNQPDNCGSLPTTGVCNTIFKLAGLTVLTLASCPEVTKGDGCADCCGELLSIAKRIAA